MAGKYQAMCPVCGCFGAPEIFLGEAIKREAILKALRLPSPMASQVQSYIGLFRSSSRGQSIDRIDKLLGQLNELVDAGKVRRNGRDWPVNNELWMAALDQVLSQRDKLTLPLKDHNYLIAVVAGMSDKIESVAETKKHNDAMNRKAPSTVSNPTKESSAENERKWIDEMIARGQVDKIPNILREKYNV